MKATAIVVNEFGEGGYLKVLANKVKEAFLVGGECRGNDMVHDVGVILTKWGMGPGVR